MSPKLKITLAGNVMVEVDGCRLADQQLGPRGRTVLACLVLERRRLLSSDELADAVWGLDVPQTWRPALRGVITRVRRFLEVPDADTHLAVRSRLGCYQLTLPDDAEVDVERAITEFEAARTALDDRDYARALCSARTSAALSRNEFLPGTSGGWVEAQQARLRGLYVAGLEVLAEAACGCGDWDSARQAAEEILNHEAYRESAYVLLMKALAGAGNLTEAMLTYRRCCDVLDRELGSSPSRLTRDAFLALSTATDQADGETPRRRTNVPASLSTFVGRTEEIVALRRRLTSARLVTLTGTAGVGKSRLALEASRPLLSTFADGVWLVELAEVSVAVAQHVSSVLRLPDTPGQDPAASLCEHLADKEMLLVLDNCEHVIADCALVVSRLLRSCQRVRVLATSRQPLHVSGEVAWTVEPLSVPPEHPRPEVASPFVYEAVQLFADRASSARPGVDVDLAAAAELCTRLDGIPLAIELAAAQARVFTVRELTSLIGDQRPLLTTAVAGDTTARHRSLAAALDWSYDLLDGDERVLLQQLSVFVGGFTAEAAETISAGAGLDALTVLARLVDKSLVASRHGTTTRFRLLETVRAYARGKLAATGGEERMLTRHLEWAYAVASAAAEALQRPSDATVLDRLDAERGNLQAALEWSARSDQHERGLHIAVALMRYWEIRGYLGLGRAWLERFGRSEGASDVARAAALNAAGVLANDQSDFASARALHSEALVFRRSAGDLAGVAASLNGLANVAISSGDLEATPPMFEEILRIGRQLDDRQIVASCLVNLAVVTEHAVDEGIDWPHSLADAYTWLTEALTILRTMSDLRGVALTLENLGVVSALGGQHDRAREYFQQCLDVYRQFGDKKGVAGTVRFLGQLSYRDGDYAGATLLVEECLVLEQQLGSAQRVGEAFGLLGAIAQQSGNVDRARDLYEESLSAYGRASNPTGAEEVLRRLLELEQR